MTVALVRSTTSYAHTSTSWRIGCEFEWILEDRRVV